MKTLTILLATLLLLPHARADECRLKHPIPLPGGELREHLMFGKAVVSEAPRFSNPEAYAPGQELFLNVFPSTFLEDSEAANWAAAIATESTEPMSLGHANMYFGLDRDDFLYEKRAANGEQVLSFGYHGFFLPVGGPEDPWYGCPICGKGDSLTKTTIKVKDGMLTSVKLTFPVEVNWTNPNGEVLLAYTGEHQTLCVLDAQPEPAPVVRARPRGSISRRTKAAWSGIPPLR